MAHSIWSVCHGTVSLSERIGRTTTKGESIVTIKTGTVSHGTMREEDLIPAFMSVLDSEAPDRAAKIRDEFGAYFVEQCCTPLGMEYPGIGDTNNRGWLLEAIWDAMEAIAPVGMHFGAIEGDGSDYGFWADEDEDDDPDEDEDDIGPQDDGWIHAAYERQHPIIADRFYEGGRLAPA
jgi:hypothetical protein